MEYNSPALPFAGCVTLGKSLRLLKANTNWPVEDQAEITSVRVLGIGPSPFQRLSITFILRALERTWVLQAVRVGLNPGLIIY